MNDQNTSEFSPEVVAAAKANPSLEYEDWNVEGCQCEVCVNDRKRVAYLKRQKDNPSPAQSEYDVELSARDKMLQIFAERGITPIPDDEVTDKGDHVIWNKYDPDCTLIVMNPNRIEGDITTIEQLKSWYGHADSNTNAKYRAYPDKPIRIEGWFKVGRRYKKYYATGNHQWCDDFTHGYRDADYATEEIPRDRLTPVRFRDMPTEVRKGYMRRLLENAYSRDSVSDEAYHRRSASIEQLFATAPTNYLEMRGVNVSRYDYIHVRVTLREIGAMIRQAEDTDHSDFIDTLDNLHYSVKEARQGAMVDAWNERSTDELTVASCDHVCLEEDVHEVRRGTACDNCFVDHFVWVENTEEYDHRDNVYRHDDDCYYTYQQESDDDWDENGDDDDDDESSVGGRIKTYNTNVLSYCDADSNIKVSQYGEVLMGVELEVVPKRGYREDTARHTADTLCDGYAILKNDGSLDTGGFEIVTAPRGLKEHIDRFTKWTPHKQLRAWDPGCCGLHVHLSSKAFSQATLGKFIEFINAEANDDLIIAVAGRHPKTDSNAQSYCRREGSMKLGNPKKNVQGKSSERYRMVNTCNLSYKEIERLGLSNQESNDRSINTVELRIFRASLNKARLLAQIEFAHAAVMFCRWSSMRELRQQHFLAWLRKTAGTYPNLAKWFGVKANSKVIVAAPKVRETAEV